MSALAAAAGLVLGALAATRGAKSPLSVPLAILAADQFAWNTATVFLGITGNEAWRWLGTVAAPFFTPGALWFILVFVGRLRSLKWLLIATWAIYGAQSLVALVFFLFTPVAIENPIGALSTVHLLVDLPLAVIGVWLIVGHWRRSADRKEASRARLLLIALGIFVSRSLIEPVHVRDGRPRRKRFRDVWALHKRLVIFRIGPDVSQ